jgi:hypothetical protein
VIPFDSRPPLRERRRSGQALLEILRGVAETIRETLPSTYAEAGAFLSGFCYAFVLHWVVLFAVTYAHCRAAGSC